MSAAYILPAPENIDIEKADGYTENMYIGLRSIYYGVYNWSEKFEGGKLNVKNRTFNKRIRG